MKRAVSLKTISSDSFSPVIVLMMSSKSIQTTSSVPGTKCRLALPRNPLSEKEKNHIMKLLLTFPPARSRLVTSRAGTSMIP